jgi:hypothetical protein
MAKQLHLRVRQSAVTYEAAFAQAFAAAVDAPGKVAAAFLSWLSHFGVALSDVDLDEGSLEDRGVSCEVAEAGAEILLRADRFEIRYAEADEAGESAAELIRSLWHALIAISPEIEARSHSLLFEMDCELGPESYGAALETYCTPYPGLPKGTETAVVYYLPADKGLGYLDSNVVLNRSAEVDGGVLLAVTLVFDGKHFGREGVIRAGRERLNELLANLDLKLGSSV